MLKWLLTWHVLYTVNIIFLRLYCEYTYRKPPTISPGLIYFRKRFLMGLYKGGLISGGLIHGRSFVLVINKANHVKHKQVSHKQENKHVLSSDYWAYINLGTYIRWAYIRGGGLYLE